MGGAFDNNTVEEIKSRCNIVDVIGQVVPLKKAGSNFKGLCPFHNEKTPSFVVSESKQFFTCFGCGASGDVIEFVKRYYHLEFPEAIEKLGKEYGIVLRQNGPGEEQRTRLYELNRAAARFFFRAFFEKENPGYMYMRKRGIDPDTLKKFGVGYADGQWKSLYDHLTREGFRREDMLNLGLISESKGSVYDKFRDRVMFPIINTGGKVIGFGGRTVNDGTPKYLNSSESAVFLKKNNLYGLNLTRQEIGRADRAILVEGYMDVISLYQAGVRNVSASLGTALTENQARLLKRYTGNVVLSYDSDEAGKNATLRGLEILHGEGLKVKALHVPSGKDPDEYIKANGRAAYEKLVDQALPYADYRLVFAQKGFDLSTLEGKVDYVKEAVKILRTLSPVEAEAYIRLIAERTKIADSAIRQEYLGNTIGTDARPRVRQREGIKIQEAISLLEKDLLKLSLTGNVYFEEIRDLEQAITSPCAVRIFAALEAAYDPEGQFDIRQIADGLESGDAEVLARLAEQSGFGGHDALVMEECRQKIRYMRMEAREAEIITRLSMAEEETNTNIIETLTKELMNIQQKKRSLREEATNGL